MFWKLMLMVVVGLELGVITVSAVGKYYCRLITSFHSVYYIIMCSLQLE